MAVNYPTSEDKKIQLLSDIIVADLYRKNVGFCIEETELAHEESLGFFGCLSLFLLETKENYEKVYNNNFNLEELASGYAKTEKIPFLEKEKYLSLEDEAVATKTLPIEFRDNEEAYFNAEPFIEGEEVPFVIFAHFLHYTVDEYIEYYLKNEHLLVNGRIPIDSLREKWESAVRRNKVQIKPKKNTASLTDKQKN